MASPPVSIESIFTTEMLSSPLLENVSIIVPAPDNLSNEEAIIQPEPVLEGIMKLDMDTVDELYTIGEEKEDNNDARYMDFHFVDSGIAYGETERTSVTVTKTIKLDQLSFFFNINLIHIFSLLRGTTRCHTTRPTSASFYYCHATTTFSFLTTQAQHRHDHSIET